MMLACLLVTSLGSTAWASSKGDGRPADPEETAYVLELYDLAQLPEGSLQTLVPDESFDDTEELYQYLALQDGETLFDILSNATADPDYRPFCIGTSVAPGHVVTAAQCVAMRADSRMFARAGGYNGEAPIVDPSITKGLDYRFIEAVKVHPDYPLQPGADKDVVESYTGAGYNVITNDASGESEGEAADVMSKFDLALLRLQAPFNPPVAIELATPEDLAAHNYTVGQRPYYVLGRQASASRWGGEVWQQTLFEGLPGECPGTMTKYKTDRVLAFSREEDPGSLSLCAWNSEYKEGCTVDRGAPAMITVDQYSSALAGVAVLGCTGNTQPAFFVDVVEHADWIQRTISDPEEGYAPPPDPMSYMDNYDS